MGWWAGGLVGWWAGGLRALGIGGWVLHWGQERWGQDRRLVPAAARTVSFVLACSPWAAAEAAGVRRLMSKSNSDGNGNSDGKGNSTSEASKDKLSRWVRRGAAATATRLHGHLPGCSSLPAGSNLLCRSRQQLLGNIVKASFPACPAALGWPALPAPPCAGGPREGGQQDLPGHPGPPRTKGGAAAPGGGAGALTAGAGGQAPGEHQRGHHHRSPELFVIIYFIVIL